jgi:hypothetical protein
MPFPVVCGTSHNSSQFESYGLVKLEDPHMLARSPKSQRSQSVYKEDYLNNKVNGELSNYGK